MTDAEKLSMLKTMTGEKDEDVLSTYLSIAGNKVLKLSLIHISEPTRRS